MSEEKVFELMKNMVQRFETSEDDGKHNMLCVLDALAKENNNTNETG